MKNHVHPNSRRSDGILSENKIRTKSRLKMSPEKSEPVLVKCGAIPVDGEITKGSGSKNKLFVFESNLLGPCQSNKLSCLLLYLLLHYFGGSNAEAENIPLGEFLVIE